MAWLGASGGLGAADCDGPGATTAQDGMAVDVPASIPEVTAMGGTEFAEQNGSYWSATNNFNSGCALSYISPQAWDDNPLGGDKAATGGGGRSTLFPLPLQTRP